MTKGLAIVLFIEISLYKYEYFKGLFQELSGAWVKCHWSSS